MSLTTIRHGGQSVKEHQRSILIRVIQLVIKHSETFNIHVEIYCRISPIAVLVTSIFKSTKNVLSKNFHSIIENNEHK